MAACASPATPTAGPRSAARRRRRTRFGLEMQLLSPQEAQDAVAADDRSRTWSAPRSCRPTARPTPPTSPRRWPRARAWPASRCARSVARHRLRARARPGHGRCITDQRPRSRCEKVVLCAGQWTRALARHGRRQRAAGLGPAPVHRHRADRRRDARPADPARSRPADLLQGGGRRAGDGRLRAEPEALGRARPAGTVRVPAARRGLGSFRADHGAGAGPRAGARARPASSS